jgi:uroporphyrinogen decarboxylase
MGDHHLFHGISKIERQGFEVEERGKRETMSSRERVLAAINHKPLDRVPIDLGMHFSTGISAFAYWNLREYLGLSTDAIEIVDMVQFLARVDEDILKRFHCDCILLKPRWKKTHRWNPRGRYVFHIPETAQPRQNERGEWVVERNDRMRMPQGGFFFDGDWLKNIMPPIVKTIFQLF